MTIKNEKLFDFIKLSTGIENLDTLLRGGFEPGLVHIYGPPATGKSNFLEAVIIMFRDLDLNNAAAFGYEMDYIIQRSQQRRHILEKIRMVTL